MASSAACAAATASSGSPLPRAAIGLVGPDDLERMPANAMCPTSPRRRSRSARRRPSRRAEARHPLVAPADQRRQASRRTHRSAARGAETRQTAVKARRAGLQQLRNTIVAAPNEVRDQLRRRSRMQLIRGPAASRPDTIAFRDPAIATRIALPSLARCIVELSTEIAGLDELIAPLVEELAPQMLRRVGFASKVVGQLLVTAGDNRERLSSEAAWAMLCGSAPLPASSGQTQRHRLNRGGDRAANIGRATKSMLPPDRYDALVAEFHRKERPACHPPGAAALLPLPGPPWVGRPRLCESGVRAWVVFGGKDDVGLFDDERRGLEGCPRNPRNPRPDSRRRPLHAAHHPGRVAELILEAVCAAAQTPTQGSSSRSSTAG
jgi:hypothetical protein